ncbi:methylated-DNA--[protein]-cysteine S-methyltransferase [Candidatus Reidiella endopervernicosa]|uniref:methylated-DNA--[protein]-cysteine S-methyltransferase n=1 Tax=Candidatus Reidiella endopervernicosa TaxID=2738883 RepID=UPI002A4E1683|nr:methylated-DNA--[protein]-cysteine S-methyltransferase [Candidatus Reidiella endopervernicosa]
MSPKRFLQFLTKEHARQQLRQSQAVLQTTIEVGLSSPGRLHDLMVTTEAMTPGEVGALGQGVTVNYGEANTPFGRAMIGWTSRGICNLAFCDDGCEAWIKELAAEWSAATLSSNDREAADLAQRIFAKPSLDKPLHLLLRGTNFQIKVWEALLSIGSSQLSSYGALASAVGSPRAQRAVGSAVAANRIGFLIPCHRVIRESGEIGQYRWGSDRKAAMEMWEAAQSALVE